MSDLQIQLKIQQNIRDYEDVLVQKIEAAFEKKYGQLDSSQYQNLVQVALSTESPEVIKNFLRYQTGRDTKWGRGEGSLAEEIIKDIQGDLEKQSMAIVEDVKNDLRKKAKELAEAASDVNIKKDVQDSLKKKSQIFSEAADDVIKKKKDVHIELIRRYLGYGKRHLIYLRPKSENSKK
jgi:hypothetical protein